MGAKQMDNKQWQKLLHENALNEKYPDDKAFNFIADQLVNAWEHSSEKELVNHLHKETKVEKKQLASAVKEWYKDHKLRTKLSMGNTKDIRRWLETHLVQHMKM